MQPSAASNSVSSPYTNKKNKSLLFEVNPDFMFPTATSYRIIGTLLCGFGINVAHERSASFIKYVVQGPRSASVKEGMKLSTTCCALSRLASIWLTAILIRYQKYWVHEGILFKRYSMSLKPLQRQIQFVVHYCTASLPHL